MRTLVYDFSRNSVGTCSFSTTDCVPFLNSLIATSVPKGITDYQKTHNLQLFSQNLLAKRRNTDSFRWRVLPELATS